MDGGEAVDADLTVDARENVYSELEIFDPQSQLNSPKEPHWEKNSQPRHSGAVGEGSGSVFT
jgi:hypothetical protein